MAVFWAAVGSVYRLMAGLPLALYLPGYTLTAALFANRPLDRATRALLSVACSLLLTVLSGLLLNTLPWGLQPATWALALGLICWIGGTVAVARRAQHPAPGEMPQWPPCRAGRSACGRRICCSSASPCWERWGPAGVDPERSDGALCRYDPGMAGAGAR